MGWLWLGWVRYAFLLSQFLKVFFFNMKFCIKNFSPKLRTKFTKWVPQAKRTECVTQPYWSKMLEIPQCYWKSFSNSMKSNFSVFIVTVPICTLSGCLREISHPLSITHADWQLLTELVHYYWICWILISWCYSHYCLQFSASDPSTDCQAHGGTKCQHAEESKGWDNEWCSDPHIWGGCSGPHFESHCCGKYYLFSCSLLWEGRIALLWFFIFFCSTILLFLVMKSHSLTQRLLFAFLQHSHWIQSHI